MGSSPSVENHPRLGLHYFPDTLHYRVRDLEGWLPELERMGVSWLTLFAPPERAIPEYFIRGLLDRGIQPILHFQLPTHDPIPVETFRLLFRSYARWGVSWAAFFDRPNSRSNWDAAEWAQADLVERFLDLFIPVAEEAAEEGLTPIFPPLEPGGDYWDLSFLRSALQGLRRRGRSRLLDELAFGAYAWIGDKPLSWGAGGPARWPDARPYHTPDGSQDQRGFRIFDWYLAVASEEIGRTPSIFLLRAGALPGDQRNVQDAPDLARHAELNLAAARLLGPLDDSSEVEERITDDVIACCFWLLSSSEKSAFADQAWFSPRGEKLPVVQGFYRLGARASLTHPEEPVSEEPGDLEEVEAVPPDIEAPDAAPAADTETEAAASPPVAPLAAEPDEATHPAIEKPLSHYVLLPLYAWGAADWDLEAIQPLFQESHPTVGFSLTEARLAARVTVVGGEGAISGETLDMLRKNGCVVERILEDGTFVAS